MIAFTSREQATEAALAANASFVHLIQTMSGQNYIAARGDATYVKFLIAGKKLPGVISVQESYRVMPAAPTYTSCERCKAKTDKRFCGHCSALLANISDCSTSN